MDKLLDKAANLLFSEKLSRIALASFLMGAGLMYLLWGVKDAPKFPIIAGVVLMFGGYVLLKSSKK